MPERRIIHVDMDAFFASVEQRDHPELRGKPVAVGSDEARGVVSTASYEARKYGVHSAMSMMIAKKRCPQLIVVHGNHEHYSEVSQQIHDIFKRHTDLIEPLSIDEAFLDVTDNDSGMAAEDIAKEIKQQIKDELQLTASAGVSYNKFLAKIASDYNKPDGLFVIRKEEAQDFIAKLPITQFWGVGPKTAQVMHRMGIFSGLHLRQCSLAHLTEVFGKAGQVYYDFARGVDERAVVPVRIRKSVGCERTFTDDISRKSVVLIELYHIVLELIERLDKSKFVGCTLTLKIKFFDFAQITRSLTHTKPLKTKDDILPLAKKLLSEVDFSSRSIRLMGLAVSNPPSENERKEWVEGTLEFDDFMLT